VHPKKKSLSAHPCQRIEQVARLISLADLALAGLQIISPRT
jgi:hypothetical protein